MTSHSKFPSLTIGSTDGRESLGFNSFQAAQSRGGFRTLISSARTLDEVGRAA